jgi:hypothetical protein
VARATGAAHTASIGDKNGRCGNDVGVLAQAGWRQRVRVGGLTTQLRLGQWSGASDRSASNQAGRGHWRPYTQPNGVRTTPPRPTNGSMAHGDKAADRWVPRVRQQTRNLLSPVGK